MIIEQLKTALKGSAFADRYELQKLLGAKPGRYTFLGCDRTTNELVVTKIFKFSSDGGWDDLRLFQREAATLRNISHPAIPAYLDYLEIDSPEINAFVLVQSYVDAPSISSHLKAGKVFQEAEVQQIAKSLLETLIYLQQFNPPIVHRDIKPSNILWTNPSGHSIGEIYLVDFGSVQNIAAVEEGTFTIVGTYGYMPLEQFSGKSLSASDIYSLGATLICLLTGKHPSQLPKENLRLQFNRLITVSPSFYNWLNRAIAPSLEERFTSARIALDALVELKEKETRCASIKPADTNIKINKSSQRLQISICSPSLSIFSFLWPYLCIVAGPILAIIATKSLNIYVDFCYFSSNQNIFLEIFSGIFCFLSWWIILCTYVVIPGCIYFGILKATTNLKILAKSLFKNKLIFQPKKSIVKTSFLSFNWVTELKNISRLEKRTYDKSLEKFTAKSVLIIWSNNEPCVFSKIIKGYTLNECELDWLSQEISCWLDLPLIETYCDLKDY